MGQSVNVDAMVDAFGNVPADVLNVSFLMASPFTLMFGKYADTIEILDNKEALLNFLRMEKWLFGGPDVAGEAYGSSSRSSSRRTSWSRATSFSAARRST